MSSKKHNAQALSRLDATLAEARWSDVIEQSRGLLSQPAAPFAVCFRAMTLACEALGKRWEALFFGLLWEQAAAPNDAKAWLLRLAEPTPALSANAAELVAFVAALPSTWQAQPEQWLVKVLAALRARSEASLASPEAALALMEGFVRLDRGGTRSAQQKARPLLEAVIAERPSCVEGWSLLARARFADGDVAGGEECVRQARRALELPSQDEELAAVARVLGVERPSHATLLSGLRWMLVQSNQHGQNNERICGFAEEELALSNVNRLEVLHHLVPAAMALGRHEQALANLRALCDEGAPDEEGELHYSLAREWMRAGGHQAEALGALRVAIERDAPHQTHGFATKAQSEPLFEPLLHEPAFLAALHGLPTADEVDELLAQAQAKQLAGASGQALSLTQQALQKVQLLEQPLKLGQVLGVLAQLQTTLGSAHEAVASFRRALEFTPESQPVERTALSCGLALALQDAGLLEQAAQLYEAVLTDAARAKVAPEEYGLTIVNAWRLALQQGQLDRATELARRRDAVFAAARSRGRSKAATPALDELLDQAQAQTLKAITSARSASERQAVYQRLRSLLLGYPDALPLSRPALRSLFSPADATTELRKNFLVLVMLPIEERLGRWFFAGKGQSFGEALTALESFAEAAQIRRHGTLLADLLANEQGIDFATQPCSAWSYDALPHASIGPHRLVFLAEGGAPYDDFAVCMLEVPSFAGAPIARRKPRPPRHKG